MEIIELKSHKELPAGVEYILFEPPFYGKPLEELATEFKKKYGNEPQTIYQLGKQLFVVKEEKEQKELRKILDEHQTGYLIIITVRART